MSKILDGKKLSVSVALKLARKIKKLTIKPKLVIIQIGDLDESNTYIKNKKAFAEKIGAIAIHKKYPKTAKESRIISDIIKSNRDASVHGIMVQLPAPKHFDIERVLETISPKKDVDGLTSINTKHLFDNHEVFNKCLVLIDVNPSTSFLGLMVSSTLSISKCFGAGSCTIIPWTSTSLLDFIISEIIRDSFTVFGYFLCMAMAPIFSRRAFLFLMYVFDSSKSPI